MPATRFDVLGIGNASRENDRTTAVEDLDELPGVIATAISGAAGQSEPAEPSPVTELFAIGQRGISRPRRAEPPLIPQQRRAGITAADFLNVGGQSAETPLALERVQRFGNTLATVSPGFPQCPQTVSVEVLDVRHGNAGPPVQPGSQRCSYRWCS